ncbi:hypothetical protein LSTR_LSTR008490 [Laodelphax striatellus]|uniref:Uncharacterized protein n=1 Tax=Laodelphax striatellus TaxID=195883 RepID=A0A482WSB9_LAOST|nr:hypothetical protein LSTR_LSTR008490 [Laodelphax striatellus]
MWLEMTPVGYCEGGGGCSTGAGLRHSASFSCLSGHGGGGGGRPHRARTATLPAADTDYGFVRGPYKLRHGVVPEEDESGGGRVTGGGANSGSIRDVLLKKSASLLSPTAWWSARRTRASKDSAPRDEPPPSDQRRWRSLGALLRAPGPPAPLPMMHQPPAQSFYLLDDFLRPAGSRRRDKPNTSSSDSLELSSPVPPPVPPPPPPLRLLGYRKSCECVQCGRGRDYALLNSQTMPHPSSHWGCNLLRSPRAQISRLPLIDSSGSLQHPLRCGTV